MRTTTNTTMAMPLLMSFTPATRIEEEVEMHNIIYDEKSQMVYDFRTVGTKSLKTHCTKKTRCTSGADKKNEIDDKKNVK